MLTKVYLSCRHFQFVFTPGLIIQSFEIILDIVVECGTCITSIIINFLTCFMQTSKLKSFLQESKSLSLSYMTSLNELLSRYDGQGSDYCKGKCDKKR